MVAKAKMAAVSLHRAMMGTRPRQVKQDCRSACHAGKKWMHITTFPATALRIGPLAMEPLGIIGSGRVARALALGFAATGAPVLLWGRDPGKAQAAARQIGDLTGRDACKAAATLGRIARDCGVIAIAVSDDAIAGVVAALAAEAGIGSGALTQAPLVFHVSGGSGAALLAPVRETGAATAAIHPAMTFTGDPAREAARMRGARFAVTGSSADALRRAHALVAMLGGVPVAIAEEDRALYHAALSHAANHLVTLIAGAARALRACHADDPAGLIAPLVQAALDNSLARGFDALSGPIQRGDAETVRAHLAVLARRCPEVLPAYRAMARATLAECGRHEGAARTDLHALLGDEDG